MLFLDKTEDVRTYPPLIGYVPVVERAWESLDLDGVLFSHGHPVLYLKESPRPLETSERIRLHRLFWNQGVANILVMADPSNVYIYSALATPLRDDSVEKEQALVEMLEQAAYAQGMRDFFASLATGDYYSRDGHKDFFQPGKTVDAYLLDQLDAVSEELSTGHTRLPTTTAHAFLGRLLFACYLLDRDIVSFNGNNALSDLTGAARLARLLSEQPSFERRRDFLYNWFAELKEQFNGTMFDQDLEKERTALRNRHMKAVTLFLGGHEVRTGQRTLGFWAYDFKMIPVETISAIYESFLADEDPQAKRESGAFYTPRFLAEMVLDIASEGVADIAHKRCIDPACGSGIFLVTLFSRMAITWLNEQSEKPTYAKRVKAFQRILREQIRGVDIKETACRIACFSLYLAYLDLLEPSDVREYARKTGKALPKLLSDGSENPSSSDNLIPVVRCADSLKDAADIDGTFDVVVGNPPWKERPDRLAQRFAERTPDFLKAGGTGCLLLPTALLLNRTDNFQARWLRRITLERIVNLADYRLLLFRNAVRPALIARFRNDQPQLDTATIQHDAPKFRRDSLREGCVTINPADRSWIPLRNILAAAREKTAPVIWKRHLWGTPRDQKFLDLLLDMPELGDIAGPPAEGKRWAKGQGFQPHYVETEVKPRTHTTPKHSPWPADMPFLEASRQFALCLLPHDCTTFWTRLKQIGASTDFLRRSPDERVLFQDTIQSISGPPEDQTCSCFSLCICVRHWHNIFCSTLWVVGEPNATRSIYTSYCAYRFLFLAVNMRPKRQTVLFATWRRRCATCGCDSKRSRAPATENLGTVTR
jgi:hypothetical protein